MNLVEKDKLNWSESTFSSDSRALCALCSITKQRQEDKKKTNRELGVREICPQSSKAVCVGYFKREMSNLYRLSLLSDKILSVTFGTV